MMVSRSTTPAIETPLAFATDRSLSRRERAGVRGSGLWVRRGLAILMVSTPSPCPSPDGGGDRRLRFNEIAGIGDDAMHARAAG